MPCLFLGCCFEGGCAFGNSSGREARFVVLINWLIDNSDADAEVFEVVEKVMVTGKSQTR